MEISTTRFGSIAVEADDILLFPHGIVGFEPCQHWVLLGDADNASVGWLQSITRPEVALAVISPRRFVGDYHLRVTRRELASLQLGASDRAYVLSVVSSQDGTLTANLKAPIVINLSRRLGAQVVAIDDQPLQHELLRRPALLRKSA